MKNNEADVAIYLLNLSEGNNLKFPLKSSSLLSKLEYEYLHQSYELRNYPGDNFDKAKVDYMRYFGKKYPEYHEFFQNEFINP